MAANEYYNQKPLPDPAYPPTGYYGSGQASSAQSTYSAAPPSYASQTPDPADLANPAGNYRPSPFETPFDDHVYPASTHQTPSSSQHQLNDIPLEPQGGPRRDSVKDTEMQDHVYDAPDRRKSKKKKGRVRFGELGMLGADSKRIPFVVYFFTIVQVGVFIGEIVKNSMLTGTPIMIKPSFNPMIGPSPYVLINMGSRFTPCMHNTKGVQGAPNQIAWPCPNTTTSEALAPSNQCTLSELCGFGGVPEPSFGPGASFDQKPEPNQWFRFIVPMFMHYGLIHIGLNLLIQLTMGRDMEKAIGPIRFALVYLSSGIFGFVMGGNFAAAGLPSVGASGSLFGVIALTMLDLFYSWKDRRSPGKDLVFILLDVIIAFVLGLLPFGFDNFAHIGGFLMGLALGICVLHSPNSLRRRIGEDVPYAQVNNGFLSQGAPPPFFKNPVGFFKGRKPLWWAWWLVRAGALVLVTVVFILMLNNFYIHHNTCDWCKYLSCLPVNNWCELGNLNITKIPDNGKAKRDLFLTGMAQLPKFAA